MRWLRWVLVIPAACAGWYVAFVVGVLAVSGVSALCPPELVLASTAMAPAHRTTVAAVSFAVGAVAAIGLGIHGRAYVEVVSARGRRSDDDVDSPTGAGPAMTQDRWTAVDAYIDDAVRASDEALEGVLKAGAAAGLPAIAVSPSQGKFLHILAKAIGAKRILELGTLAGYSAIWLARALPPDGRLVTVELDPARAEVARRSFARAGVSGIIDLRVGAALDVLRTLETERAAPFDFVFIDADKGNYPDYFDRAVRLSRPGALIVADNVVRDGEVIDASSTDPAVIGVRRFMERVAGDRSVTATALQTVGVKGYDGFAIVLVGADSTGV